MDLKCRYACAVALAGALVSISGISRAEISVSTVPLSGSATGVSPVVVEPYVCPLATKDADIVSPFGKREVLVSTFTSAAGASVEKMEIHEGVDYNADPGTLVRAARSGRVIFAGFSKMYVSRANKNEQHRFVIVRHADGQSSRYVHLSGLRVRPGQDVKAGQVLGVVAPSDEWMVPVLHFEIRDIGGRPINPESMIKETEKP
jgi:murein DD-endopeptidase MepM/ murein hydrolase activator NlpD